MVLKYINAGTHFLEVVKYQVMNCDHGRRSNDSKLVAVIKKRSKQSKDTKMHFNQTMSLMNMQCRENHQ